MQCVTITGCESVNDHRSNMFGLHFFSQPYKKLGYTI